MTIRFAAAIDSRRSIARHFDATVRGHSANDGPSTAQSDALLRAALLHFAEAGLSAAEIARENAERAFFENDRHGYTHWLGICRLLDARMARAVEARRDPPLAARRREA